MRLRLFSAFAVLSVALVCVAQEQIPHPRARPAPIRAQGCVEAGVETGCLLVRDLKTGRLYNLLIRGMPPPLDIGVEFTGTQHNGPSTCMQGIAVEVESWSRKDALKCPHHPERKK
jgi:hypothetical protein